jgi:hypothetical protein
VRINTVACFDTEYSDPPASPIDRFFEKHQEINRLSTPQQLADHPVLSGLALLGSVSAVESFFRELFRRVIVVDELARRACESRQLSFGAASVHAPEMLPEALIEEYSFASRTNIQTAISQLLGLGGGKFPSDVDEVLSAFGHICEFRHCMIHRFGKLDTKNAIQLGLTEHQTCVEKPLVLDYAQIQRIFQVNYNTVKTLNNYLGVRLLERTADEAKAWSWDFRKDKRRFTVFFGMFQSNIDPPEPPITMKDAYERLRNRFRGRR